MSELKIDSERVLKASESCSQAKEILRTLFPEVFEKQKEWENVSSRVGFFKGEFSENDIQGKIESTMFYLCVDDLDTPFVLLSSFNHDKDYKIANGKLWRLKK